MKYLFGSSLSKSSLSDIFQRRGNWKKKTANRTNQFFKAHILPWFHVNFLFSSFLFVKGSSSSLSSGTSRGSWLHTNIYIKTVVFTLTSYPGVCVCGMWYVAWVWGYVRTSVLITLTSYPGVCGMWYVAWVWDYVPTFV